MGNKDIHQLRDEALRYIYENGAGNTDFAVNSESLRVHLNIDHETCNYLKVLLISEKMTSGRARLIDIGLNEKGQSEAKRLSGK